MIKKKVEEVEIQKLEIESKESLDFVNSVLKEKLLKMRKEGKITMAYVVKLSGVNEAHLYQWIRGDYLLSRWVTIMKIASVLHIKIIVKE